MAGVRKCYLCGATSWLERHHVFGGPYRTKSDNYGYVVDLCHYCHNEPPNGVHHNKANMDKLRRIFQRKFEETGTREEFIREFGRNYL